MRYLIALALLASCFEPTGPVEATPDAPPEAPIVACPIATWRDAYVDWETARCNNTQRCFPDQFAHTFANVEECVAVQLQRDCAPIAEAFCGQRYTHCNALPQCVEEMSTLSCDAGELPDSCSEALE